MSARLEFIHLARAPGANVLALCEAYKISRKTGYKWLKRFDEEGEAGLSDRSRRPHHSPAKSDAKLEAKVLRLHEQYDCWGSRKLQALLPQRGNVPHPSTIDAILRRHGRQVHGGISGESAATKRFEHPEPNMLWQMDFKGHFALSSGDAGRCHPLTVLDDYSRFNLCLAACGDEQSSTVRAALTRTFRRYGLPDRITTDNGPPWGTSRLQGISALEAWLIRLGIRVSHSRPYHPQTQGKDERFHRTLKLELVGRRAFRSLAACQAAFDTWRDLYNQVRPHQALGQTPPITRYRRSGRAFPRALPSVEYLPEDWVLKVRPNGQILVRKRDRYIGEGLAGERVALRPTPVDGFYTVYFCDVPIRELDLRAAE
jgi:transposase InsO family protein